MDRRRFVRNSVFTGMACAMLPSDGFASDTFMGNHIDFGPMPLPAPEWLRDAVIAEIPTRGFNVSDYKNPSRWASPFGDTTYKSIAAKLDYLKDMGYNVLCLYSVYNCTPGTNLFALSYTEPNPDMGTLDDAKKLIDQAHARGMYVISNTNHYGVAVTSPLLNQHPDWFLPESDKIYSQRVFDLNNKDALAYIIGSHVSWCTTLGLDGWRIDSAGHVFKRSLWSQIVQRCADKGKRIMLATENKPLTGYIQGSGRAGFPPILDMQASDWLRASADDPYCIGEVSGHNVGEPNDPVKCCAYNSKGGASCGREGCFKVKGSRFIYGHNSIFAPRVPWMLVGETFDATHLSLPNSLENPKMLHSWLDWNDVASHKDVVDDFRRIAAIRTRHKDLFHNNIHDTKLINVPYTATPECPAKPYARFLSGTKAGIVIGNNSTTEDVTFALKLPLATMGLDKIGPLKVTDCWTGAATPIDPSLIGDYSVRVPRDKTANGGVRVLIVERARR